ncbi:mitochondrial import protein Pam17 [Entophlyctis helioformis]|nr:mitochondrial import protein Pam17 [Entophlyctis helioformis]
MNSLSLGARLGLRLRLHASASHASSLSRLASSQQQLAWKDFFAMRKSRKSWSLASTLLSGWLGLSAGSYYFFFVAEFDPTTPLLGLPDPMMAYIMAAMGVGALSALGGSLSASQLWRLTRNSNTIKAFEHAKKELYDRILKHRPKELPMFGAGGGPGTGVASRIATPPDYYGEKIYSAADYRAWIRKQRRFISASKL